jgi:hypothetical protein
MSELQPDGATRREHLESVARQTRKTLEELMGVEALPVCPEELRYLWEHFDSMSMRRQHSEGGAQPLSSSDVAAWASLHGVEFVAWEMALIDQLEVEVLNYNNKKIRERIEEMKMKGKQ